MSSLTAFFYMIQQYLTMFGATVALPLIICPALCIEETDPARAYIISTIFFVSGLITILQATFGVRFAQHVYRTRANITRSLFETALDFKPRILWQKIEECFS